MSITRELQTTGATPVASRLTVSRGTVNEKKKPQISDFCHHKADTSPPGVLEKLHLLEPYLQFKKCLSVFLLISATFLPSSVFFAGSKPTPE